MADFQRPLSSVGINFNRIHTPARHHHFRSNWALTKCKFPLKHIKKKQKKNKTKQNKTPNMPDIKSSLEFRRNSDPNVWFWWCLPWWITDKMFFFKSKDLSFGVNYLILIVNYLSIIKNFPLKADHLALNEIYFLIATILEKPRTRGKYMP